MFRKLIAGILFSVIIIPGNVYAASDEDTKRAIESFYGEYGFMNKIWACERLSRTFDEAYEEDSLPKKKYRYALSEHMSDEFYKEYEFYMTSFPNAYNQLAHAPLTERIFFTYLRDLTVSIVKNPSNKKIMLNVFMNCVQSSFIFISLQSVKRDIPSAYAHFGKHYRNNWEAFLLENPAPKIAPLQTEQ